MGCFSREDLFYFCQEIWTVTNLRPLWIKFSACRFGRHPVVRFQAETCLRDEFWFHIPQGAFSPSTHSLDCRKTSFLAVLQSALFIYSWHFCWSSTVGCQLCAYVKTSFVLCVNPGFVCSPLQHYSSVIQGASHWEQSSPSLTGWGMCVWSLFQVHSCDPWLDSVPPR